MLRDVTWALTSCGLSVLMLCCEIWFEWAECSDWDTALGFWVESGFRSRPDVVQSKLIPVWIGLAVWTSPYRLIGFRWPGRTNKSWFLDFGKVPFPPLLFLSIPSSSTSLSTSTLTFCRLSASVSGGWAAAVSHVSVDLCPSFHIENNWNDVLEQSEKKQAGRRKRSKRSMRRRTEEWKLQRTVCFLSDTSDLSFSLRHFTSNYKLRLIADNYAEWTLITINYL